MKISKVDMIYFSPTGSTKKVVRWIGSMWRNKSREIDVTPYISAVRSYELGKDELAVIGVPSYGGRVPAAAAERIGRIKGNNTPAVVVAAYGNRAYEDTLAELSRLLQKNGFRVLAGIAAVTEHSILRQFGAGRPDGKDKDILLQYARQIRQVIQEAGSVDEIPQLTFGNKEAFREYRGIPIRPHTNLKCIKCGLCSTRCPVHAIPADSPDMTNEHKCISCMGCVSSCPHKARGVNKLILFAAGQKMKEVCRKAKPNELILGGRAGQGH